MSISIAYTADAICNHIHDIRCPLHVIYNTESQQYGTILSPEPAQQFLADNNALTHVGTLPALYPEYLGNGEFNRIHGSRYSYIVGEMANGIATSKMVVAAAKNGLLGFFGSAGLVPSIVEENIHYIKNHLNADAINWGSNLIHSPNEPSIESGVVDLYIKHNVQRVSAAAYMSLSPHIVRYACHGLRTDPQGKVIRKNYVFAKISRTEVARHFMCPPPENMLADLVQQGLVSEEEANIAKHIPLAEDITVESDSGGHTDNQVLTALFPTIYYLGEELRQQYGYPHPFRIGAAGGLGTPSAVAAAYTLGASYVLTGTVNEACVESGMSDLGKEMLTQAQLTDVSMAAAADMFEMGVELQVLKRGTLFAQRANKLYQIYQRYKSIDDIPEQERKKLETTVFRKPLMEVWETTKAYFNERDPIQVERAEKNPHHLMALVFRWYLGFASRWAILGEADRRQDFQIWCGPAMGAFNRWSKDTFLEKLENRTVAQIGLNLLEGAAIVTRAQQCRTLGMPVPHTAFDYKPRFFQV